MPELRWILIVFGLALLIGIYAWGRRNARSTSAADEAVERARPDAAFESAASYEDYERPLVAPIEDVEADAIAEEPLAPEPVEFRSKQRDYDSPRYVSDESQEPTIEVKSDRSRGSRIEPTFSAETVTAELPVDEPEAIVAPVRSQSSDAPTLSMSNTPPPKRIERRKIIALRLACGAQRLPGAELKRAFDTESLQHGKYDVFHRLDSQGAAIFSVASMMEPGTFDLDKMPQESYPGITLFTQLPAPVAGMLAFNELIACSRRLHAALGGTLQDERGVPLTVHRVERIRQEIREFEHRPATDAQRPASNYSPAP